MNFLTNFAADRSLINVPRQTAEPTCVDTQTCVFVWKNVQGTEKPFHVSST